MALSNTHYGYKYISALMGDSPKNIFFDGIGGVSMNSLAHICHMRGHTVSGYDRTPGEITRQLAGRGIKICYTFSPEFMRGCEIFVYTIAMPDDDPAYLYAREAGIPCISRADFLGYVMKGYAWRIGISGMHGKSTTTAIAARIFDEAGLEPTVFGGAGMKETGTTNIIGAGRYFIFEACEYKDSFLDFYPTMAVVLNIEMDHVDYFASLGQIKDSFARFIAIADTAVINISDENVAALSADYPGRVITFSTDNHSADYSADHITYDRGCPSFDLLVQGRAVGRARMKVPGRHIPCDALAAAAAAHACGISPEVISLALSSYAGVSRRMDLVGMTNGGADVYDDYAHHPTELSATLSAARELGYQKVRCVFQPHTFSRTAELFDDFARVLADAPVDEMILAPIYPARETNTYGVSSESLAEAVRRLGGRCTAIDSFDGIAKHLGTCSSTDDAIFVIGAGDITSVSQRLIQGI